MQEGTETIEREFKTNESEETVIVHDESKSSPERLEMLIPREETQLQVLKPELDKVEPPHFFSYPRYFYCRKCNFMVECQTLEQNRTVYYFHKRYGCQLVQLNPGKFPKVMGRKDLIGAWEEQKERRAKKK